MRQMQFVGAALKMLVPLSILLSCLSWLALADWPKMSASIAYNVQFLLCISLLPNCFAFSDPAPPPPLPEMRRQGLGRVHVRQWHLSQRG